ncbi:heparan-alpha-glucosaminide N-acetyltransferase domain-containing protein [uncultured Chitinophaga sp.]|uniref:DUF1624 domain-containing protein n=1 Tax=uncultured Chitinophaga sp. TaxID=339340 RepID=UPI0025E4326A|nr:heparan-alpha-glucosaminide N-acetyltransferase domain-containing protein [uncultured Chitinophaga sp.]
MNDLITPSKRITSVDLLRGLIMVIMALDHTRDFTHDGALKADPLDVATTTPVLFFTRWITHFCAPLFVFLAGVSAWLSGRSKTPAALGSFLIKRGLWLILVEIVLMTLILTADPGYHMLVLAVIWAIGFSMIILGLLVRGSYLLIFILGALLFLFHNVTDYMDIPQTGVASAVWGVLMTSRGLILPIAPGHVILSSYAILPWTGVLMLGYCAGRIFTVEPLQRKRILVNTGTAAILLFIILRYVNGYGDPAHWEVFPTAMQTFLSFINTTKYPPSLLFLCMTIGPGLLLLAAFENKTSKILSVYGRVPFFYYVTHFFLIRVISIVMFYAQGYGANDVVSPFFHYRPADMGVPLWGVYVIWISVVAALYLPCKWFGAYKQQDKQKVWLSYL